MDRTALTVNEQLMSREAPAPMTLGVVQAYIASDTSRSGVLNVRHITWTAYERATHREVDMHKRASGQERRKRDRSSRHVCQRVCEFRDLSVLGMSQQCIVK